MRSHLLLFGVAVPGVAACTVPAPEPAPDPTSSTATAIVVVERTEGVRGDAILARFVRVRQGAVDDGALRMAGVAEDLPAAGTCATPVDDTPAASHRAVELLDVGQVVVGGDKTTALMPRAMPDPAGVVSGVFYSSRATDVFTGGSPITVRASGGADLGESFNISVTAPRELTDLRVAAQPAGLDVAWEKGDASDLVYVDVLAPRVVTRCAAVDGGHLVVPAAAFAGIDEGQLAVHRLHREPFKAKGIDPGEVRFDVAKTVSFRR